MERVLITGALGQLGLNLSSILKKIISMYWQQILNFPPKN